MTIIAMHAESILQSFASIESSGQKLTVEGRPYALDSLIQAFGEPHILPDDKFEFREGETVLCLIEHVSEVLNSFTIELSRKMVIGKQRPPKTTFNRFAIDLLDCFEADTSLKIAI
jgi:hypothetical protein